MLEFRGRYYKYKGELAQKIIDDYSSGMLIKDIIKKYQISYGGLYGLLKREIGNNHKGFFRKDKNGSQEND